MQAFKHKRYISGNKVFPNTTPRTASSATPSTRSCCRRTSSTSCPLSAGSRSTSGPRGRGATRETARNFTWAVPPRSSRYVQGGPSGCIVRTLPRGEPKVDFLLFCRIPNTFCFKMCNILPKPNNYRILHSPLILL